MTRMNFTDDKTLLMSKKSTNVNHTIYPSRGNLDFVKQYKDFIAYKEELTELLNNEHCSTCNDCFTSIKTKLKQCDDDHSYTINLAYEHNPFFLGFSSSTCKGLLVDGQLLTNEDIRNTPRASTTTNIVTPQGFRCIPYDVR